jgi:uncharacterized protein with ParB-like and HNH nuclease domain
MKKEIEFELVGIATALNRDRLKVPANQREYSWLPDVQVKDLLQDISNAIKTRQAYFLGTVVLTTGADDFLEVSDGQQRLATTTMILAVIRDWFDKRNEPMVVQGIENDYLFNIDIDAGERLPRLTLNLDDNEYFRNAVICAPKDRVSMLPTRRSHRLISSAMNAIRDHINILEKQLGPSNIARELKDWCNYLKNDAKIVKLSVADAANAFKMFETLNDRGLKTSQADLVKNYLFEQAAERLSEAQNHWSSMRGAVESVGDDDDLTMEFLRLSCCIMTGLTRERDVMSRVQSISRNKSEALKTLVFFDELSQDYSAILNPDNRKWNDYDVQLRKAIQTINILGVKQIRPLMLSVARFFNKADAAVSFRRMVSWSVRFMVIGARGGRLDEGYARLANGIFKGEIKNATDLKNEAAKFIVTDAEFQKEFEVARVSTAKLARYYLRSLETTARGQVDPEFLPNEDTIINLEHVLPQQLDNWSGVLPQDAETHFARIGNMALLQATKNSAIGSSNFNIKREVYKKSSFVLTSQISEFTNWTTKEIEERQKYLAELAVKTWAL